MRLSPLAYPIIKIFGNRFFKTHLGLFIFLFVLIISYGFFIPATHIGLLSPELQAYHHFIVVTTFINDRIKYLQILYLGSFFIFNNFLFNGI